MRDFARRRQWQTMEPALPTLNEDLPVVYMGSQLRTACINRLQIHDVTAHTGILTATHIYMHLLAPAMARIIPLSLSSYQLSSAAMLRKAFVQLAQVGQRATFTGWTAHRSSNRLATVQQPVHRCPGGELE